MTGLRLCVHIKIDFARVAAEELNHKMIICSGKRVRVHEIILYYYIEREAYMLCLSSDLV